MGARLALLSGAPLRYGYRDEADPRVLTHALAGGRYREPLHETAYSVRVVSAAASAAQHGSADDMPPDDLSLTFPLTAAERRRAADLLIGVPHGVPLVAIHPGAANGAAKRWLPERWAHVADTLAGEGVQVTFLGSADERPLVERIVAAMHPPGAAVGRSHPDPRRAGGGARAVSRCRGRRYGTAAPRRCARPAGGSCPRPDGPSADGAGPRRTRTRAADRDPVQPVLQPPCAGRLPVGAYAVHAPPVGRAGRDSHQGDAWASPPGPLSIAER